MDVLAMKIALILVLCIDVSIAYRILGILPYKGPSHNIVMMPLFDELAQRGHDVYVISYYPKKTPTTNYTSLPLELAPGSKLKGFYRIDERQQRNPLVEVIDMIKMINVDMERAMMSEHIQTVAKQKWDAVIVEYFNTDMFASLAHVTGAHLILFHTAEILPFQNIALGEPIEASYIPHPYTGHPVPMSFWDRLVNTMEVSYHLVDYYFDMRVKGQALAEKYLGPLPEMSELIKNASLFLMNSHPSFHGSRPLSPFVVQVGGIHLKPKKPLPQETLQLIEKSKGIIYFSMGSVLSGDSMTKNQMDIFLTVFPSFPLDVLWKYEGAMENKPPNVHIRSWLPQRDILGHSKTILFISHCGLLSIEEALTEGVPIICIPIFADQFFNARRVETLGIGESVDIFTMTATSLKRTIDKVLNDPSYKQSALRVKDAFNDRPLSAMDAAVYWVEYVVRQNGAPHLKCAARFLPLYQLYNLDVWAVLLGGFIMIVGIIVFLVKLICGRLCRRDNERKKWAKKNR